MLLISLIADNIFSVVGESGKFSLIPFLDDRAISPCGHRGADSSKVHKMMLAGFKSGTSPDESSTQSLPSKHRAAPLEKVVTTRLILSKLWLRRAVRQRAFHTAYPPNCDKAS